uniref:L-fucose mutarotase n=1 Tax=Ornithorhynchus anatinus TaxID=9258 RepID=A0A6I8NXP6_ORNAN
MVMLKGVPRLLSPDLLFALAKMGHGDDIVLADANFPTSSVCQCGPVEIRADGVGVPQLLEAILKLLPLDTYVDSPATVMDLVEGDKAKGLTTPVWTEFQMLLSQAGCNERNQLVISSKASSLAAAIQDRHRDQHCLSNPNQAEKR